ncbi:MAG: mevalonate kinase [Deltaproteobacteria bacterium]|nr:mevalonate kinase [Deltaproteobacteria bacterium]
MSSDRGQGTAPGKIILLGEHAAVYGYPAVGLPLAEGARVSVRRGSGVVRVSGPHVTSEARDVTVADLVRRALGSPADELDADVELEIPIACGLGSSAAVAVAAIRAGAEYAGELLTNVELVKRATDAEVVVHGSSSGLDPTLAAASTLTRFRKTSTGPEFVAVTPACELVLVVTVCGSHGGARLSIGALRTLRDRAPEAVSSALATLGSVAERGIEAIEKGELELLGQLMNLAHGTLAGLGFVSDRVESAVRAARAAGALGAKMSGAGGAGGAIVALTTDPEAVESCFARLGGPVWVSRVASSS